MKRRIAVVCIGVLLASAVLVGNVDGKEPEIKGRGTAYLDLNGDGICDNRTQFCKDDDGDGICDICRKEQKKESKEIYRNKRCHKNESRCHGRRDCR